MRKVIKKKSFYKVRLWRGKWYIEINFLKEYRSVDSKIDNEYRIFERYQCIWSYTRDTS